MSDDTVCRFRRESYSSPSFQGITPRWHLARKPYSSAESSRYFDAVCGYRFDGILGGVKVSNAKRPPDGQQCQDCLRTVLKRREPS